MTAPLDRRTDHRVTFAVLCIGVASFSLLQSMVNPVLPTIEAALGTDQATVSWVLTAYLSTSWTACSRASSWIWFRCSSMPVRTWRVPPISC